VQWLTAGRGVVHAEVPAGEGVQRGINIWVNLATQDKMYVSTPHITILLLRILHLALFGRVAN
jgi:redox-sensitive bicupin YhaK (pirin superfamily)